MLSFLVQEGILTVGALSGIFTAYLLNSLKLNIIDPATNKFLKEHNVDLYKDIAIPPVTVVNWKMFLKDFIIWLILMILIYIFWRYIINPNNNFGKQHKVDHHAQLIPMNLNKK